MSSDGAPRMASKRDATGRADLKTAYAGRPPPAGLLKAVREPASRVAARRLPAPAGVEPEWSLAAP
jgi:hypothetical protein